MGNPIAAGGPHPSIIVGKFKAPSPYKLGPFSEKNPRIPWGHIIHLPHQRRIPRLQISVLSDSNPCKIEGPNKSKGSGSFIPILKHWVRIPLNPQVLVLPGHQTYRVEGAQGRRGRSGAYPAGRPGIPATSTASLGLGLGLAAEAAAAKSGSSSTSRRGRRPLGPGRRMVSGVESRSRRAVCPAGPARRGPAPRPRPGPTHFLHSPSRGCELPANQSPMPPGGAARLANRKAAGEGLEGQVPGGGRWGLEFSGLERKSGVRY